MCGILFSQSRDVKLTSKKFEIALSKQSWRGPDAFEISNESNGVMMGHVRLSILDLASRANQPMLSSCGRYKIIYNG